MNRLLGIKHTTKVLGHRGWDDISYRHAAGLV